MKKIGIIGGGCDLMGFHLNHLIIDDHIEKGRGIIIVGAGMKDSDHVEFAQRMADEQGFKVIPFENERDLPMFKQEFKPDFSRQLIVPTIPQLFSKPESRRERRARERKTKKK